MTDSGCFLVVEAPDEADEKRVPLGESSVVIGRDEGADVPIEDPKLSRRHAAFRMIDGHPYVEDLGSINGVKVRGRRIEERRRLRDGERVRLGNTRVRVQATDLPPPTTSLGPRLLGPDLELSLGRAIRVGRTSDCQLRSEDPTVSRFHAMIEPTPPTVRDMDSAHGVFVNDRRVRRARLKDGDELRFGKLGFEVEIPMDVEGPRELEPWRSPWPRRVGGLISGLLLLGGLGLGLSRGRNASLADGSGPTPSAEVEAPSEAPEEQASEPVLAIRETLEPSSPKAPVAVPPVRRRVRAVAPKQESFSAPPSWRAGLRAYFAGEPKLARARARAPELVAWLDEAETRHARALTEVSNDVERAKLLLGALARTEARVSTQVSPMRRDLRVLLAAAFAEDAERLLEQSREASAYQHLMEARALDAEHPRVRALAARLDSAARTQAKKAESLSRAGDQRACGAWRKVAAMTSPSSRLGREARGALARACEEHEVSGPPKG